MCDLNQYLRVNDREASEVLEAWRQGTMRVLLILMGLIAVGHGCLEARLGGDEFGASLLVFGGLYVILMACRKGGRL